MDKQEPALSDGKLKSVLECMLFVSPQPLSVKHIAESLDLDEPDVERVMHELRLDYGERGLQIVRIAAGYQMCTRPEHAEYMSALLKPERTQLSRAALETVAIIAYRQPITQPEVDAIRGVNSDTVLRTLLERSMITQIGRRATVGRPIMYATTDEFLNHFGLNDLSELPEPVDTALAEPAAESGFQPPELQPALASEAIEGEDSFVE